MNYLGLNHIMIHHSLLLLIAFQVLDLISTALALRNPNLVEANGLLKPLFDKFGVLPTLAVVKSALIGFLVWAHADIYPPVIWLLCAGYAYVVFSNFKLIITTQPISEK